MSPKHQHSAEFQEAIRRYHDWDLDGSKKLFSHMAAGSKSTDEGFYGLGLVHLQRKNLKEAEENFEQCRQVNPSHNNALYYLGYIAYLRGDYLKANEIYEQVLSDTPEHAAAKFQYHHNIRALIARAKALHRNGKVPQSRRLFRALITTDDYKAAGFYGLGVISYLAGDLEEARTDFMKAVKLHPKHANAHYYLGQIARQHKDPEESEKHFKQALRINPKHVAANREMKKAAVVRLPTQNRSPPDSRPAGNAERAEDGFLLPENRRPFLSAYAGRIVFGLLMVFMCLLLIMGPGMRSGPQFRVGVLWAGLFVFAYTAIYVLRIKRTVFNFDSNGMLTIERGVFGSSVKTYDLRYLVGAEPRQTLLNRLTHDGSLTVRLRVPSQRGGGVMIRLTLRGLAKWDDLKAIGSHLNSLLQGASG